MQAVTGFEDLNHGARGQVRSGSLHDRLTHVGVERLIEGNDRGDPGAAQDREQVRLHQGHPLDHRSRLRLPADGSQGAFQVVQDRQQLAGEGAEGVALPLGLVTPDELLIVVEIGPAALEQGEILVPLLLGGRHSDSMSSRTAEDVPASGSAAFGLPSRADAPVSRSAMADAPLKDGTTHVIPRGRSHSSPGRCPRRRSFARLQVFTGQQAFSQRLAGRFDVRLHFARGAALEPGDFGHGVVLQGMEQEGLPPPPRQLVDQGQEAVLLLLRVDLVPGGGRLCIWDQVPGECLRFAEDFLPPFLLVLGVPFVRPGLLFQRDVGPGLLLHPLLQGLIEEVDEPEVQGQLRRAVRKALPRLDQDLVQQVVQGHLSPMEQPLQF